MRMSIGLGRPRRWRLDLSSLPARETQKGSLSFALFIIVFALLWGGFPTVGLVSVLQDGSVGPETILFLVFPFVGMGLVLYGIHTLLWRRTVTFDGTAFTVTERGLRGVRHWREPLSAFQGVVRRTRHVRTKNRSYTLYIVDLQHRDRDRSINLYTATNGHGFRGAWEEHARRLGLPAIEEGADGMVRRDVADLDKSVGELIREGKVDIDYQTLTRRAEGLAVEFEGDVVLLTRTGPVNPWWGSALAVAFPLIFVGVAWFAPDLPPVGRLLIGGMGALFELLFAIGVVRDLTSRERLRIGPDALRVNRVSRAGEAAGKSMGASDVESVTVARDSGRRREIAISGDTGMLKFGKGLPGRSLEFVMNTILAKIEETERRGR